MEKEKKNEFHLPEYYENRELSWLKFDARVLNEAKDKSIPLLERLKFVSITSSNLDEFFMVRVASLKDMVHAGYRKRDIAGMTASEQLERINTATRKLVESQYNTYNRSLVPLMASNGIHIIEKYEELTAEQAAYVDRYFEEDVYPVLTPMAVDASRPFPLIRNKTLNIAALLSSKKDEKHKDAVEFATVQVPGVLPRLVPIPADASEDSGEVEGRTFILLEQIIEKNIDKLFLNYHVLCAHPYRVMRNADLPIDEDEAADLLKEIQKQLKKRQWGEVIRLEVEASVDKKLLRFLKDELKVAEEDIFQISGPIDLTFLMKMYGLSGCDALRYEPYKPQRVPEIEPGEDIFEAIRGGDILLHHPYETFDPVVDFIRQAASDPDVLAIKQTLYRVSGNSPIIASLAQAAENGKQVSVLVELKARFDEENNIVWAKKLEQAGCHVIYGLVGLKTHSKIALVVRREEDGIRRYVHLGTGNYNDSTAKLYTDCGIFTCNEAIGEDATAVFNMLSGYSEPLSWNELVLAPIWLRTRFMRLIARETKHAREGKPARIVAKMNSLCDEGIIAALYEASAAGVKIELIVRGICCLKVGIPGISENIHVRSIVGNFLEHSRIFFFLNDGEEEFYMGSADWMPRNLDRRVEILFPVLDDTLKEKVKHILDVELADNTKAHVLKPDGEYEKIDRRGKVLVNSQKQFCEEAVAAVPKTDHVYRERVFVPAEPAE
ncbi:MAG: RNA degradosome polyphosphate kinase [Roseburia hominis]|uniref:RNA degradosome polyphosphate kinase n=1 Tax=Roseburia hominis TaxID=301301 RepID=UPI0026EF6BC9|nr:RNA degradosome polyphosphate kinase [Roseburia hominis]MCI7523109.1 RNA degradosome polyphosphate kinase [Roseburia hominis]MDD6242549.1 RNA degradosome polyphosphate kinase [Roseburia hominis]